MRKQTKLVAVLSAAALLAVGASMTSFAGWEKDEDGIWHYYDSDDEMVTDEWRKDGSKWFYLDEDGNMATDAWVDDEYYVGADGAMIKNDWVKTTTDDDIDDPEDDGDHWYYFGSNGKKEADDSKKINGKTYYFNEDGEMIYGWYQDGSDVFYLGGEDEGWRAESQWLWLELPSEDDVDRNGVGFDNDDCSTCDEEGWYYFGSNGKMYQSAKKKKVNGKYYFFNDHGQMVYEWINNNKYRVTGATTPSGATLVEGTTSNALDGNATGINKGAGQIYNMQYSNVVEDGSRANGWYEIDGSEDTGTDGDTDWYYFDDGEAKRADSASDLVTKDGDNEAVYRTKIKINGKYFCFNEMGQMQTGLQFIQKDGAFYYFDENGYMQTGKETNVEDDDDAYNFYFITKNGKNGQSQTGEKDGYLYFGGKRLEADDDYRVYYCDGKYWLVNNKGKIQSSESKKYDVEELKFGTTSGTFKFEFNNDDSIKTVFDEDGKTISGASLDAATDTASAMEAMGISIPSIALYDNYYSYDNSSVAGALNKNTFAWYGDHAAITTVPSWID
ncbi:glucan-binding protein [Clostridiaceae bacterium Marseille-Q3526]|nr:glucan-binding protein [Clostridiaceae bacterium Marseille-Q3526]